MSEMLELRHISKTFGAGTINEKKAVEDLSQIGRASCRERV